MTKNLQTKIQNKKKSGFTLVELIVVIAILGILAAITIPRFSQYVENARETALDANAKTVYNACAAAETSLIADGTETVDAAAIVEEASKSLSGVTLTAATDTDADDTTFGLATYTAPTTTEPSSFTIDNTTATSGKLQWENGGTRK